MKNNNSLKISIITPCFNSADTIEDTIKSVITQKYSNFEYIIVDGNSTDSTLDIIKKYQEIWPNIKLISEKDKGIFDAMNKGVNAASGDIVGIINSDDILASNDIFHTVANEFNNSDIDIVYGYLNMYNNDFTNIVRKFKSKKGNIKLGWHPPHPTLYLKKTVYDVIGNFNLNFRIASDLDFMIRVFKSEKFNSRYIDREIVKMRAGGVSTRGLKGYIKNYFEAVKVYKSNKIPFPYTINVFRSIKTILQMFK